MASETTRLVAGRAVESHFAPIEGCRVLMTLTVITFHLGIWSTFAGIWVPYGSNLRSTPRTGVEAWLGEVFMNNGETAVECFFIISGFLSQVSDKPPPTGLRERLHFVAMRFLRLAPAYYAAVVAMLILALVIYLAFPDGCEDVEVQVPLYPLLAELSMLQSWIPLRNVRTPVYAACDHASGAWLAPDAQTVWTTPLEFGVGSVDWFVSALFGSVLLQSLLGELIGRLTATPLTALGGVALCCGARVAIMYAAWENSQLPGHRLPPMDGFGSFHAPPLNLSQSLRDFGILPSEPEPMWMDFAWHWAPSCFPTYLAGVCTARLVNHLPPDGPVRTWRGWVVADSIGAAIFLGLYALPLWYANATVRRLCGLLV